MKKFIFTSPILMLSKNLYGGGGGNPPLLDTSGDGTSAFTYNSIAFNSNFEVRNLQDRFSQAMGRTVISILPGTLPFLEKDLTAYIEPQIERTPSAKDDDPFRIRD